MNISVIPRLQIRRKWQQIKSRSPSQNAVPGAKRANSQSQIQRKVRRDRPFQPMSSPKITAFPTSNTVNTRNRNRPNVRRHSLIIDSNSNRLSQHSMLDLPPLPPSECLHQRLSQRISPRNRRHPIYPPVIIEESNAPKSNSPHPSNSQRFKRTSRRRISRNTSSRNKTRTPIHLQSSTDRSSSNRFHSSNSGNTQSSPSRSTQRSSRKRKRKRKKEGSSSTQNVESRANRKMKQKSKEKKRRRTNLQSNRISTQRSKREIDDISTAQNSLFIMQSTRRRGRIHRRKSLILSEVLPAVSMVKAAAPVQRDQRNQREDTVQPVVEGDDAEVEHLETEESYESPFTKTKKRRTDSSISQCSSLCF